MAVRRQGVSGLLVFHRQDSISMAFHIGRELVERQSVKLVVRHAGCLRLKFVQTYRYIAFRQVLNGDWISSIIHQYIRITAYIYQMNHFIIHFG